MNLTSYLLIWAICGICIFLVVNMRHGYSENLRHRRLVDYIPEYRPFDYPGKRVRNTTTSGAYTVFKETLAGLSNLNVTSESFIPKAVDALKTAMGWNSDNRGFINYTLLYNAEAGVNFFDYKLKYDQSLESKDKKRLEEFVTNQMSELNEHSINSMFDMIVLTGNTSNDVNFLNDWFDVIENVHVIVIQQGDPDRFIEIPSWVDYELYNKYDVEKALGEHAWIVNIEGNGVEAANMAFLASDRQFVYIIDRDCVPIGSFAPKYSKKPRDPRYPPVHPLLLMHAKNLMEPSTPFYHTMHGPYTHRTASHQKGSHDFPRGYPYKLREGLETAISMGAVYNAEEYDSLTKLLKTHGNIVETDDVATLQTATEAGSKERSVDAFLQDREIVQTVPYQSLFSLSLKNTAFNRKHIGPAFVLLGGLVRRADFQAGANFEVLAGWILKATLDNLGLGVKEILNPVHLYERHNHNAEQNEEALFRDLKADLTWMDMEQLLVTFFNKLQLSDKSKTDLGDTTAEIANQLRGLESRHVVFRHLGDLLETFRMLHCNRNGFAARLLPIASRAKYGPKPDAPHKCAAFTIAHNESVMLNVWLRYYGKHFPGALWVLNHHSGEHDDQIVEAVDGKVNGVSVHTVELFGDDAGFPMGFFIGQADLWESRFLRYGYTCVLLSDVDEMVVPDPAAYPGGLVQYIAAFANDTSKVHTRVQGFILAHISQVDGDENTNIEPPLNWSKNILEQRKFYCAQPKYNKPLLSKVPMRYKPGFHTCFLPFNIGMDDQLWMFHLREVDKEFCLQREYQKYLLMQRAHQSEVDKAFNGHILGYEQMMKKGETCQFALSTYYRKYGGAFENTGKARLAELEPKWKAVEL